MYRSSPVLAAVFAALSVAACASPAGEEDSSVGGDEAAVTASSHADAVRACDQQFEADSAAASHTHAMIQASASLYECVRAANDAAIGKIEANLTEVDSYLMGSARESFDKARAQDEALCAELDKASWNFGGTLSYVEAAACRAQRERFLAKLVDAYVYFGGELQAIPEARAEHPACYAEHDRAMDTAVATTEMMQAAFDLTDCVSKNADELAGPLAQLQIDNDPAVGSLESATAAVKGVSASVLEASGELCAVLNEAGDNGGGSLARVTTAYCQVRVAEALHGALKVAVGE